MNVSLEKTIILILSILIIPSLITGPFLPDLFLVIFGLMILYKKTFLKKEIFTRFKTIIISFIFLFDTYPINTTFRKSHIII